MNVQALYSGAARQEFPPSPPAAAADIVGAQAGLRRVLEQAQIVARTDSTVLIQGETGTGKEVVARFIHQASGRTGAFVQVNCSAIPAGLLESELFGHEKGAFTGALMARMGRFELANHGTLFLDEIGDLPLELQPKLLRVLQEREIQRLGGMRTTAIDVRVVAATNQDLARMAVQHRFRTDLYYRLCVFPIELPPLRARREDIPALVRHFADHFAERMGKTIRTIPESTLQALAGSDWPGNVRQLQNLIQRAVILSSADVLDLDPRDLERLREVRGPRGTLREAEREFILRTLEESRWVVGGPRGAAAMLGIPRTTLISKMKKLGIAARTAAAVAD